MPAHPLGEGGRFRHDQAAGLAELGKWYGNAQSLLAAIVGREKSASPIICWPHHFDIATLIDQGEGRSVGVGLSPGDQTINEPYWYVSPWPHPTPDDLPALGDLGHWHSEGFTAAILTGTEVVAAGSPEEQRARCEQFLSNAITLGTKLLGS